MVIILTRVCGGGGYQMSGWTQRVPLTLIYQRTRTRISAGSSSVGGCLAGSGGYEFFYGSGGYELFDRRGGFCDLLLGAH